MQFSLNRNARKFVGAFVLAPAIVILVALGAGQSQAVDAGLPIADSSRCDLCTPSLSPPLAYVSLTPEHAPSALADDPVYRVARRLHRRLTKIQPGNTPPLHLLVAAVEERRELLRRKATVQFQTAENPSFLLWDVSLHRYPLWITPEFSMVSAHFRLSARKILDYVETDRVEGIPYPVDAALFTLEEKKGVLRAVTDGVAQGGLRYDASSLADRLYRALLDGAQFLDVALISTSGRIRNATSQDLGDLALIGEGHSDFRGSGGGRIANIHKGLTEHVHNAVVRPGETFSFNKLLDPPVTLSKGWHEALVIFDGDRLEMAPGGGICQVSTTFFRGLLAAGLPVLVRKSHSLFVTYYEKYGVGIDATVFPGQQDLVFVNDTPHHLLIQAEVTGYDAYVRIYGTPDGRNVELRGPYFAQNAPEGFLVPDRPIRGNEIAWVQNVRYSDGSTRDYIVLSRYKAIPKRVVQEYAGSDQIALER